MNPTPNQQTDREAMRKVLLGEEMPMIAGKMSKSGDYENVEYVPVDKAIDHLISLGFTRAGSGVSGRVVSEELANELELLTSHMRSLRGKRAFEELRNAPKSTPQPQAPVVPSVDVTEEQKEALEDHPLPWSVEGKSYPLADTGDYTWQVRIKDSNGKTIDIWDGDGEAQAVLEIMVRETNAHLLAHGYREQSEGGGKHVGWTDGMNVWGRFKVSDEYAKAKEWEAVYTRSTPPPSNSAVREAVEILQGLSAWLVRNPTPTETLTLQRAIVDALAALEVKP